MNESRSQEAADSLASVFAVRDALMIAPQLMERVSLPTAVGRLRDLGWVLTYGTEYPSRRKRTIMNVDVMVAKWTDNLVSLLLSHDKQDRDQADFESDELLGPILTAPVAQLREFTTKLTAALKGDPRVPFFLWANFESWTDKVVSNAKDEGVIQLKTDLARQVAELAESSLTSQDWVLAIMGALQWRAPEDLAKVRANLAAGAKPKLTGRQSCLFLEVGDAMVML